MPVRIRNTFIDTTEELSPSLERFYKAREVNTCPSAHIGRFRSLFKEAGGWQDDDAAQGPDTTGASEASPCYKASAGPSTPEGLVISIADALAAPSLPSQASEWGGQTVSGGKRMDGTVYVADEPCNSFYSDDLFAQTGVMPAQLDATHYWIAEDGTACVSLGLPDYAGAEGMQLLPAIGAELQDVPAPPDHPALGSAEMPSIGSAGHGAGTCKPCAFFHREGCQSGLTCQFCHLCGPDEKRLRRKAKLEARRAEKLRVTGGQDSSK